MGNSRPKTKSLSIKVPTALSARLASLARKRGVPVSVVVREALEDAGKLNKGSFGELAQDFCGRLAGPSDLSTNPEHLKGYGK